MEVRSWDDYWQASDRPYKLLHLLCYMSVTVTSNHIGLHLKQTLLHLHFHARVHEVAGVVCLMELLIPNFSKSS